MLKGKNFVLIFILLLSLVLGSQCKKDNKNEGRVYVDFYIDVTSIQYSDLAHDGGWMYLNGGENGILVYRSINEFYAYDRTCMLRSDSCKIIEMDKSNLLAIDNNCKSTYIILDGSPNSGPSSKPLIRYRTSFDGHYLRVYN